MIIVNSGTVKARTFAIINKISFFHVCMIMLYYRRLSYTFKWKLQVGKGIVIAWKILRVGNLKNLISQNLFMSTCYYFASLEPNRFNSLFFRNDN